MDYLLKIKEFLSKKGIKDTYKTTYFIRRLNIRLRKTNNKDLRTYYRYIKQHPEEVKQLQNDLSINVTKFFRDKESFNFFYSLLEAMMIQLSVSRKKRPIKIWSSGCAIGAEPYSLAISIDKTIKQNKMLNSNVRIFATDFNNDLLSKAKKGQFERSVLENVDQIDIDHYFTKIEADNSTSSDELYQVSSILKKYIDFSHLDLSQNNYPPNKFDAILCRNVLIYFNDVAQYFIIKKFYDLLEDGGLLFLGMTESFHLSFRNHFNIESTRYRIYKKVSPSKVALFELIRCPKCPLSFTSELDFTVHTNLHKRRDKKKY